MVVKDIIRISPGRRSLRVVFLLPALFSAPSLAPRARRWWIVDGRYKHKNKEKEKTRTRIVRAWVR